MPINLPTALQLSNVRPIDVVVASERLRLAVAQHKEARTLWLPSVQFGIDYFRHDGQMQDIVGNVANGNKGAFFVGAGPNLIFSISDALYGPLAAKQVVRARQADVQAATNDSLLAVAEAYMNVQQARGELAGAIEATRLVEELVRRSNSLSEKIIPRVEAIRIEAELARRQQIELAARERWRLASADLLRVLRLDPSVQVEPVEPPFLRVQLISLETTVDDLIAVGLSNRAELASQQALVQATLKRLKQERIRPLVPSVLLRGAATNPAGTLSTGTFGGGPNGTIGNYGFRQDIDVLLVWQLNGMGAGQRAKVQQRRVENELTLTELFRIQDRIAAETSQAFAQAELASRRVEIAERGLRLSGESAAQNLVGFGKTKTSGELEVLLIRPQEALAAVQALGQAYAEYYGAVTDANRAQFRLYRALGQPAQMILCVGDRQGFGSP
ncbi:MAG TPA: TolC family protein [Gemmataceae bacterium]|nr:TolC family protein [Gemmataceae bacterium]